MPPDDEGLDDDQGDGQGDDTGQGESSTGTTGKTFTQSDVDKIVGRRAKAAETAARNALLAELGVDDLGGLKATLDAKRQADEANMTEAEKLKAEAARAKAEAEAEKAAATAERIQSRLSRAMLSGDAPIQPGRLEDALELAQRPLREADGDEDDRIAAAVDRVRERFPEWFASAQGEGGEEHGTRRTGTPPPPSRVTGQRNGAGNSPGQEAKTLVDRWRANRPNHDPKKFGSRRSD
jgi:hypothetical protein